MRKYILLFLLLAIGLSSEVYGQQTRTRKPNQRTMQAWYPRGFIQPVLPRRDTVIMRGEEIEVGGYISKEETKQFEIIGYGKAKKADYKKKFDYKKGIFDNKYSIKLKPQQTTTYEFRWVSFYGIEMLEGRIVYVAKTAEEKKMLEEKLKANLGKWQLTTYQYVAPGHEPIKITNFSTGRK